MLAVAVPSQLFRDPSASGVISTWLSTNASPQERALTSSFLSLLTSTSPHLYTSPPPAPKPVAKHHAPDPVSVEPFEATGISTKLHVRPSTAASISKGLPPSPPEAAVPANVRPATAACTKKGRQSSPTEAPVPVSVRPSTASSMPMTASQWITTNEQFYGFRELYPDIYAAAASATKARPASNNAFKSEYSESLKKGSGEYWKQCLRSTYESTNQAVHKPNHEYQVKKEAGFFYWMRKQRLYYGELLTEDVAEKLDGLLEGASAQGKTDILAAARLLFAIIRPEKCAPAAWS
jgi:hypothetical protein